MFIPNVHPKISVGDTVILRQDYNLSFGTLTRGHLFIVIEKSNQKVKVVDESNYELILDESIVTRNVSMEEAKEIDIINKERHRIMNIIITKCPHKDYSYDEYERFDVCKLKTLTHLRNDTCKPSLECAKYCNDKTRNKLKIPLRSLKLKNLKKRMKNE